MTVAATKPKRCAACKTLFTKARRKFSINLMGGRMKPTEKMMAIDFAQAMKTQADRWPMILELYAADAKEKKAKFDAYVEAGFSTDQAISLVKGGT
jgi:hypothetical protein